jgi:hypothetical protein
MAGCACQALWSGQQQLGTWHASDAVGSVRTHLAVKDTYLKLVYETLALCAVACLAPHNRTGTGDRLVCSTCSALLLSVQLIHLVRCRLYGWLKLR